MDMADSREPILANALFRFRPQKRGESEVASVRRWRIACFDRACSSTRSCLCCTRILKPDIARSCFLQKTCNRRTGTPYIVPAFTGMAPGFAPSPDIWYPVLLSQPGHTGSCHLTCHTAENRSGQFTAFAKDLEVESARRRTLCAGPLLDEGRLFTCYAKGSDTCKRVKISGKRV